MSNFGFFFSPNAIRKVTQSSYRNKQAYKVAVVRYGNRIGASLLARYAVPIKYLLDVSYSVGGHVRLSANVTYAVARGQYLVATSTLVQFANIVRKSSPVRYSASAMVRAFHTSAYGMASAVRAASTIAYGTAAFVNASKTVAYGSAAPIRAVVSAAYDMLSSVRGYATVAYSTYVTNRVRASNSVRYSSVPYSLVLAIDGVPSVTIGTVTSTILSGNVFIDEGEGVWRGSLVVAGMETYLAAALGAPVQVSLGADTYLMFVDSRSLSMTGPAQIDTEVSLVSAGAFLAVPRVIPQTVTLDAPILVSQLAANLAGSVGIDWLLPDWTLRAGLKEWVDGIPLDILVELAEVAGGVIDALPSGRLVARLKYPVSPPQYLTAVPEVDIHTEASALTVTEEHTTLARYGSFRIMDVPEDLQDRLEYVVDELDSLRGEVFAYPQPYRTSIELVSTSDSAIVIGPGRWVYREEEEEIEILGGEGNTGFPIVSVVSTVWNDISAGAIRTEFYKNSVVLPDSIGYGLLKIKYRTLALVYTVSSATQDTSQFLLQEI